jgi:hypothetical protein
MKNPKCIWILPRVIIKHTIIIEQYKRNIPNLILKSLRDFFESLLLRIVYSINC